MRSKIAFILIISTFMLSCQQFKNKAKVHNSNNAIIVNDTLLLDDKLVNVIEDYMHLNNINNSIHDNHVYQLLIEKSDCSGTVLSMDVLLFQDDFMKHFPFGRMKINSNTVYVSSICNNPFKIDKNTQFVKGVFREKNKLLSNANQMKGIEEYTTWKIFINKDTIIIDKHAVSPYMPKLSNNDFIPPVIKD